MPPILGLVIKLVGFSTGSKFNIIQLTDPPTDSQGEYLDPLAEPLSS